MREIFERKQITVLPEMLEPECVGVTRCKVEPIREVAAMVRRRWEGIVAWAQTRHASGFPKVIPGLFQAAKRLVRGYARLCKIRTGSSSIAGKLGVSGVNSRARSLTRNSVEPQIAMGRLGVALDKLRAIPSSAGITSSLLILLAHRSALLPVVYLLRMRFRFAVRQLIPGQQIP